MTLQDLWRFITLHIPASQTISGEWSFSWFSTVLWAAFAIIGWLAGAVQFGWGLSQRRTGDLRNPITQVALLLVLFFLLLVAFFSGLWAFAHFYNCKQPQCTIIFFSGSAIIAGIFILIVAFVIQPLFGQSAGKIKFGKNIEISANGSSACLIVAGFASLLVVGYWMPC